MQDERRVPDDNEHGLNRLGGQGGDWVAHPSLSPAAKRRPPNVIPINLAVTEQQVLREVFFRNSFPAKNALRGEIHPLQGRSVLLKIGSGRDRLCRIFFVAIHCDMWALELWLNNFRKSMNQE